MASGSVNEILDGIADVQEFRDSVLIWDHLLDDLNNTNKHNSTSSEEVSTIKKKPKVKENKMSTYTSETDFLQHALSGGGGRISRSNSANQLAKSASNDLQKVRLLFEFSRQKRRMLFVKEAIICLTWTFKDVTSICREDCFMISWSTYLTKAIVIHTKNWRSFQISGFFPFPDPDFFMNTVACRFPAI